MSTRAIGARAPLVAAEDRVGVVRVARVPKGFGAPPALPPSALRIVGIDCGLARVSLAYFDLMSETRGRWYAADLVKKAGAYRGGWWLSTPADMPWAQRLAMIGRGLTAELRATRPAVAFIEQPEGAGMYRRPDDTEGDRRAQHAFGSKSQQDVAKLYSALGVILAVAQEQVARVELCKPSKLGGKTKEERLRFVDLLLRRLGRGVELTNHNDLDAAGVAIGANWSGL